MTIKKGSVVIVSSGAYSEYAIQGVFEALKDMEENALDDMIVKKTYTPKFDPRWPSLCKPYEVCTPEPGKAASFLIELGYLKAIPYDELYCGDYGRTGFSVLSAKETE